MADKRCPNPTDHAPHAWGGIGDRGLEWCPGGREGDETGEEVKVQVRQMIDAGVPLATSVETAIVQLAITAERGGVEVDWKALKVGQRTTEFTLSTEEGLRPIEELTFTLPGVRR